MNDAVPAILIAIVVIVGLFLIGREVVCWYWKVNESLAVLKEIRDLLAAQQKVGQRPLTPAEKETNAMARALKGVSEAELERQALTAANPERE